MCEGVDDGVNLGVDVCRGVGVVVREEEEGVV